MRKLLTLLYCLLWQFAYAGTCGQDASTKQAGTSTENISDISYELSFNIAAEQPTSISGNVVIYFILQQRSDVALDFQGQLSGPCLINGKKRKVLMHDGRIVLPMKRMREGINRVEMNFVSQSDVITIGDNRQYVMFKPGQTRKCFPCFDRPTLRARFITHLSVPDGWKTMCSDSHAPIPTYLYSFIAGKFQEKTKAGDRYPMRALYMAATPSEASQIDLIFDEVQQSLIWMEKYTGLRCPLTEYGMVIMPGHQSGCTGHPGTIWLSSRQAFLAPGSSQEEQQRRLELIAHETAHLWFGDMVSIKRPEEMWVKEILTNYMAAKITRRQLSRTEHDLNFLKTYQTRAIAIDRTEGAHPIVQDMANTGEAAMLNDNIFYDKGPVILRILEQLTGTTSMQNALQKYTHEYYLRSASWNDFINILDQEAPNAGVRQASEAWIKQKGMPLIHTSYQNGKLIVSQTDLQGRSICCRQKFDIRIVNELGDSHTLNVDMRQPTMTYNLSETPNYIIPNYNGNGYGRFTLDQEYTKRLALRLIVTRDDIQRLALLTTLHDNYLLGRIPPSYFGELYRSMIREKNPLIMQTCIDHMLKIAFDLPRNERYTLEQCIMDIIPENRHSECKRTIIRKMARNATSPEVLNQIYQIWQSHSDPLFDEHDYMEMAYRLAVMRPSEWQQIIATERQRLTTDQLRQEFDYISRACTPDTQKQNQLFNELLKPENRENESWALHMLDLLNVDVREPQTNEYITASLNSLEYLQRTSSLFFTSDWLHRLFATHKSAEARQKVEQFLQQHNNIPAPLRSKILEAAWPLMNKGR